MADDALLIIDDIWKSFAGEAGKVDVLRGVSMVLHPGETVALTGESGSGKSTLLHLAGALDTPDAGRVLIKGQDIAGMGDAGRAAVRRRHLGIVFQQFNLIPSLNVADNIAFQARLAGQYERDWTALLIDRLGLGDHQRKFPEQLSGGQQQRVAIGRALAPRPAMVLADEPTGNLDEATGATVLDLMLRLVAETGAGLLMVTHSQNVASRMSRQLHLKAGKVA